MSDSPLRQQIAAALRPLLPEDLPPRVATITTREMTDAVLAVINPVGKLFSAQLRHAECQLVATRAILREVLDTFDGLRNSDGDGDITHYRSPQIFPAQYERWQATARGEKASSPAVDGGQP